MARRIEQRERMRQPNHGMNNWIRKHPALTLPIDHERAGRPVIGAIEFPINLDSAAASSACAKEKARAMLLLPHGMIGFVVAAVLSATLGHANDAFNWLSAAITKDVYVPMRHKLGLPQASDHHEMRAAQVTMLCIGVAGVVFAFFISTLGGAFEFNLKYFSMVATTLLMPVFLGLIYRKTPWWSGIACVIASIATTFTMFGLDLFPEYIFPRNVIGTAASSTLVFVVSTIWYRADDPKSAEAILLDRDFRTPVEDKPGHVDKGSMDVYAMVGNVCFVLGAVLLGCVFVPATKVAPASINVLAAAILFVLDWLLRRMAR